MSPKHDQEYFADGVAEEILNALARVKGLKVIGRASSFAFRGKPDDLRTIGQKLGVANVLEGSIRKEGSQIRVAVKLVRVGDGSQAWSEIYDRKLAGIFKVQEEIARAVAGNLAPLLEGAAGAQPGRVPTTTPEAYAQFLLGRQLQERFERGGDAAFHRCVRARRGPGSRIRTRVGGPGDLLLHALPGSWTGHGEDAGEGARCCGAGRRPWTGPQPGIRGEGQLPARRLGLGGGTGRCGARRGPRPGLRSRTTSTCARPANRLGRPGARASGPRARDDTRPAGHVGVAPDGTQATPSPRAAEGPGRPPARAGDRSDLRPRHLGIGHPRAPGRACRRGETAGGEALHVGRPEVLAGHPRARRRGR